MNPPFDEKGGPASDRADLNSKNNHDEFFTAGERDPQGANDASEKIRAAAKSYIARGWAVVEVPFKSKEPSGGKGWQNIIIAELNLDKHFPPGELRNIGVHLGPKSHGLIDIDHDCPEAIIASNYLMPPTKAIFGRASARCAHRIYRYEGEAPEFNKSKIPFEDLHRSKAKERGEPVDGKAMILEVRCGGNNKAAQSIFPASVHESGEPIEWERGCDGAPLLITDAEEFLRCARETAAAALIGRYMPAEGARHEAYLRIGGVLARCAMPKERVGLFVEAFARAGNADPVHAKQVVCSAQEAHGRGTNVYGLPAFEETFGPHVSKNVAAWLNYVGGGEGAAATSEQSRD